MPPTFATLQQLYELALQPPGYACRKGCATCCTQSVTMTAWEGDLILDSLPPAELAAYMSKVEEGQLKRPAMTTNRYLRQFIEQKAASGEESAWSFAPCPFLVEQACAIYAVRPFMCRGFVSRTDCRQTGFAEVPPQVVLLNTVIQQVLEHLAVGRSWGLLSDILNQAGSPKPSVSGGVGLLSCEPVPGFLLDGRERRQLGKQLARIRAIVAASGDESQSQAELLRHLAAPA